MKAYLFLFVFLFAATFSYSQVTQHEIDHQKHLHIHNQTCHSSTVHHSVFDDDCDHVHYEIPQYFTYNDQLFDFSLKGMKKMLEVIRVDDPVTYQKLYPHYQKMKSNSVLAYVLGGASLLGGAAILLSAVDEGPDVGDPDFSEKMDDTNETGKVILGFGVILGGSALAYMIAPKKQDIFTLININNKNNEKHKIEWNIAYNPHLNAPQFGLCFKF